MTETPLLRPTLVPGLVRLWRDRHTLQLGLDPARAVVIEVADPTVVRLLNLLDGTRSERTVLEQAAKGKVSRDQARALLDTLQEAGLVVPAQSLLPTSLAEPARGRLAAEAAALALRRADSPGTPAQILRRRAAATVVVTGRGRLAAPLAVALAQAGVGHVHAELAGRVAPTDVVASGLRAADVGRPRAEAVAEAITRTAPGTDTRPAPRGQSSLVIQVGMDRPAGLLAAAYARRRQAHLLVTVRDGTPVIGPLVPSAGSPCLNCLDLHRTERDPAWPTLAAQLAAAPADDPCQAATLLTAAGYAAAEALTLLDGGTPELVGAAVEIEAPARIRRRTWPPHPACGCARRRRTRRVRRPLEAKATSHTGRPAAESVTMVK